MSLINQMLRDLSTRGPEGPPMFAAVRVMQVPARRRLDWRLVLLLAVGGLSVLWPVLRAPLPLAPSPGESLATQAARRFVRFQLDARLSAPGAPATPVALSPQEPAALRIDADLQAPPRVPGAPAAMPSAPAVAPDTDVPAAHPAPAPAQQPATAPAVARRDTRAAESRYAEAARALGAGEPATAEAALRDALALDPRLHAAREALAILLLDQARTSEAEGVLEEGLALEPARMPLRRLAARVDLARGDAARAIERLERAPPAVQADPEYHGLLAAAYQRAARHEDAARIYLRLTQLLPREAHWWAGYGLSRDALGDAETARAAYAQAQRLGALEPAVQDHIERRLAALRADG